MADQTGGVGTKRPHQLGRPTDHRASPDPDVYPRRRRARTAARGPAELAALGLAEQPGVQRKHDRYDAAQLALLFRTGELTAVRVPSPAEEQVRDLVRCRTTLQPELLQSQHYLLKFLARGGLVYRAGTHWTQALK